MLLQYFFSNFLYIPHFPHSSISFSLCSHCHFHSPCMTLTFHLILHTSCFNVYDVVILQVILSFQVFSSWALMKLRLVKSRENRRENHIICHISAFLPLAFALQYFSSSRVFYALAYRASASLSCSSISTFFCCCWT